MIAPAEMWGFFISRTSSSARMCQKLFGKRITDTEVANQYRDWCCAGKSEKKLVKSFNTTLTR